MDNFYSVLTRKRIGRGSFHSPTDLQAAIERYLAQHNKISSRSSGPRPSSPSSTDFLHHAFEPEHWLPTKRQFWVEKGLPASLTIVETSNSAAAYNGTDAFGEL